MLNEMTKRANIIHNQGDSVKYDYSKSIYVNAKTKLIITCNIHGDFQQTPDGHLRSIGCKKCGDIKVLDTKNKQSIQSFFKKSAKIHNNRYDYSKTIYINTKTKLIITCNIHGDFEQLPSSHLMGSGCQQCGLDSVKNKLKSSVESFVNKANKIHNNTYDYQQVVYQNAHNKVKILCKNHGVFEQNPQDHLNGQGCRHCSQSKQYSKKQIKWLSSLSKSQNIDIQHALNGGEYRIQQLSNRSVDGYCKETNTIYQFHGSYYHSDPKRFPNQNEQHPLMKQFTHQEVYEKTLQKDQELRDLGYNLIIMWETDFDQLSDY